MMAKHEKDQQLQDAKVTPIDLDCLQRLPSNTGTQHMVRKRSTANNCYFQGNFLHFYLISVINTRNKVYSKVMKFP